MLQASYHRNAKNAPANWFRASLPQQYQKEGRENMANAHIATYLNDHLAGAVAAVELLGHLAAAQAGTALEPVLAEVRAEVATDRQELEALMARLQIAQSRPRQATAWLA